MEKMLADEDMNFRFYNLAFKKEKIDETLSSSFFLLLCTLLGDISIFLHCADWIFPLIFSFYLIDLSRYLHFILCSEVERKRMESKIASIKEICPQNIKEARIYLKLSLIYLSVSSKPHWNGCKYRKIYKSGMRIKFVCVLKGIILKHIFTFDH